MVVGSLGRTWLMVGSLAGSCALIGSAAFSVVKQQGTTSKQAANTPRFEKDILPLLNARCMTCHGEKSKLGGLDLHSLAGLMKGGSSGAAVTKGAAAKSLLYKRLAERTMPPPSEKKLTDSEIKAVATWIDAGAHGNAEERSKAPHWAFRAPVRHAVPKVKNSAWIQTPIDAFVLSRLEAKGIKAPKLADRRTLLRRIYLDVIGLPPTTEEQARFLNDPSPQAWTRLVDDLLARPQYGERWARHWLDLVRYAESNGYERDNTKKSAWRYRDYVIDSLNKDKPYDRFLTEQLAGDELPDTNAEAQIATTFLRLGTWDDEPADPAVDHCDQMDDILGTTSAAFLAQTLRCARCHDHKFEPFTQKDYYRFVSCFEPLKRPPSDGDRLAGTPDEVKSYEEATRKADAEVLRLQASIETLKRTIRERIFTSGQTKLNKETIAAYRVEARKRNDVERELVRKADEALEKEVVGAQTGDEKGQLEKINGEIAALNGARPTELPRGYVLYEDNPTAPKSYLLIRGEPSQQGDEVTPGVPGILTARQPEPPVLLAHSTGRRLWLAQWMTRPGNPLTARVMVNRLWQHHFSEGIVPSENDFGVVGQKPKDLALLDWLATEFVAKGWSLKKMHRLILLSNTYKMASDGTPGTASKDADTLFWRWPQRRLEAEAVRDSILAVSGQLNPERGGASIYPEMPRAVLEGQSVPGQNWGKSDEKQANRRSIYIFIKRSLAVPELDTLDAPDTTSSCERRPVSTVAPQALTFLNGDFIRKQSRAFAARLVKEVGASADAQVTRAFELTLCRPPSTAERAQALGFLEQQKTQMETDARTDKKDNGDTKQRALESFCLVMLNTNEFVYMK